MSAKDNGGPAFPEVVTEYHGDRGDYQQDIHSYGGMTMRQYFAAKAMQGLLAGNATFGGKPDRRKLVQDALAHADELLQLMAES